jgi:signal transduction histidine kinase
VGPLLASDELAGGGFGLGNIKRRVEELGGRLTVNSAAEGFTVAIVLALKPAETADHSEAEASHGQGLRGQAV